MRPAVALVVLLELLAAAAIAGCTSRAANTADDRAAVAAARRFLHDFVAPTGAVVRHDQGGDTVSEGQGYALLMAYAVGDRALFARVWSWTRAHLQRPDGLLSYHWQNGTITGADPAADADTQIAWALALAGSRWSQPAYRAAADHVARAIAAEEIGYDDQGQPTLAAGTWAITRGRPVQVEPGYWTFPAYAALAALTGDRRWKSLSAADAAHLRALSQGGASLPADWATVGGGTRSAPSAAPSTGAAPASGQDGLRAMVWAACLPATHPLATRWWHAVAATANVGPFTRSLSGTPAGPGTSPLSLVAAAADAEVAGDSGIAATLLRGADRAARQTPTYYGEAWDALGRLLLTTNLLPGCSP